MLEPLAGATNMKYFNNLRVSILPGSAPEPRDS